VESPSYICFPFVWYLLSSWDIPTRTQTPVPEYACERIIGEPRFWLCYSFLPKRWQRLNRPISFSDAARHSHLLYGAQSTLYSVQNTSFEGLRSDWAEIGVTNARHPSTSFPCFFSLMIHHTKYRVVIFNTLVVILFWWCVNNPSSQPMLETSTRRTDGNGSTTVTLPIINPFDACFVMSKSGKEVH